LNQNNLVALVVTEQTITAYVNHQQIEGVQNNEFDYHAGGFFLWAGFFEGTSEIIYRNARGWLL